MSAIDQIVNVNISQQTKAVAQQSFSIPAIYGTSNRFAAVTTTATTVSGSAVLTVIAALAGVVPGAYISGTGIPAGNYIASVNGSTATMLNANGISPNATASASGVSISLKDSIRSYTTVAGMIADGFQNSDAEVVLATELLEQPLTPTQFFVGNVVSAIAQVVTVTPDTSSQMVQHYIETINGTAYDFTSDSSPTAAEVVTGLTALINGDSACAVTASGSTTLILTAKVSGASFIHTETSNLVAVTTTGNHSMADNIAQSQLQSDLFYGVAVCSNADGDIEQIAAYIESQLKIYLPVSSSAAVATSANTDVGSVLKAKSYNRSGLIYTNYPVEGKDAALLGGQLPAVPGSNNWAYKTLVGCTADALTDSQINILRGNPEAGTAGKNVNIYTTIGGQSLTQMGTMASGQFIDITVGLDWLKSTIQVNLFSALVNASKIPYTDQGTGVLIQAVRSAIDTGVANGLIDGNSPISVTAPSVLSVSANQRAKRIAPTISFTCRLQGAFNAVIVNGTVTV